MALVVASKIKDHIKKQKMRTAGDFMAAVDKMIIRKIDAAIARAKANKRKTVIAEDI